MKKIVAVFFTTSLIALFSLVSCDDKNEMTNEKMSLDVAASYIQLAAVGIGNITFDWGDDTKTETFVLSNVMSNYSHKYQSGSKHTIKITGRVTSFYSGHFEIDGSSITNQISALDASNNSALQKLDCSDNQITQIDVSKCTELTDLACWCNQLTTLNLNDNKALIYLRCWQNKLTKLDVSNNKMLIMIGCGENKITKLDMSNNLKLKELYCDKNSLTHMELNNLFETLHSDTVSVKGKFISISDNPGSRFCTDEIAKKKGWTVYK